MADPYRDFVPEGEDAGALGNGFTDFVPAKEPVKQPVEAPVEAPKPTPAPVAEQPKKK